MANDIKKGIFSPRHLESGKEARPLKAIVVEDERLPRLSLLAKLEDFRYTVEVMDAFLKQPENENGLYKMGTTDRYLYAIPSQEIANYNDKSIMWQNDGF